MPHTKLSYVIQYNTNSSYFKVSLNSLFFKVLLPSFNKGMPNVMKSVALFIPQIYTFDNKNKFKVIVNYLPI